MGMMINRRRVCGGKKGLLPSGYRQVEYIESTGTQYIDTGVSENAFYQVEFKMKMNGLPSFINTYFIGNLVCTGVLKASTNGRMFSYWGNKSNGNTYYNALTYTSTFVVVERKGYIKFNNYVTSFSVKGDATTVNIKIGKDAAANIWYFKIWGTDETLVRNFIPCKNPNNVVGMYDTVNGVFYQSASSTAFVAGPEV